MVNLEKFYGAHMTHQPLGLNDITVFAPPCLTPDRAYEIYRPAFERIMEFVVNSRVSGDVYEFGTFHGYTARTLAQLMSEKGHSGSLYLFDSWEGFPSMEGNDATCPEVTEHKTWKQGDCTPAIHNAEKIIQQILSLILPNRVQAIKGFYDKTLDSFLERRSMGTQETGFQLRKVHASIVHIDCDLYESTYFVLKTLLGANVLQQGTVVMFDDWNNNFASNEFGERKAVRDLMLYHDQAFVQTEALVHLEPWFSYGSSGMAFIVQKA
jgi:hypothetical protein